MQLATGIVVFFMIWWIVLLLILPFNFQAQKTVEKGTAPSAPKQFSFKQKALYTSLISLLIFVVLYGLIAADVFSFREIVLQKPLW